MSYRTIAMRLGRSTGTPGPDVERAGPGDLAFLAMDTGPVPEQFGALLFLDDRSGLDTARVRELLDERIRAVPRLRQRLVRTAFGYGGPIWVDDEAFDLRRHVRGVRCTAPGDEDAVLSTALSVITEPLPRNAPLWRAAFITGLVDGRACLVLVLHHVLADGIGGLAVLGNLVDPGPGRVDRPFPRPRPARSEIVLDGLRRKVRALRSARASARLLRASMSAGGGVRPPRAADCSLMQRTGPARHVSVVRTDRARLRAVAHGVGATTNDAVLVAVAGALHRVLLGRGETVDSLVVTVPVSGRRTAEGPALGNMVSPMIVAVPTTGPVEGRLREVAAEVRAHKASATAPPPIALLGWLFRPLARLGGYHWYMNHQHRFHTLVSHLRGPDEPLTFGGSLIGSAAPVAVAEGGNATVYFGVLTYAGTLTMSVIVDPEHFPDHQTLTDALRAELRLLSGATKPE